MGRGRVFFLTLMIIPAYLVAQNPVELGSVRWYRDYASALQLAQKSHKPLLILFQEIPGCQTCQRYGQKVLTHPLIVDAIEHYFVPLAIYNNRGGADAAILKKYGEPAWNNPVVRIINAQTEQDLVGRVGNNYTPAALVQALVQALSKNRGQVPEFLTVLQQEFSARSQGLAETTYAMYCFWTGEKLLGSLEGVIQTRAGFAGGREVVKVWYDPSKISAAQLDNYSQNHQCEKSSASNFRGDRTPKYFISNSPYRFIPMSETQASRINSALGLHQDARIWLSPTQLQWLEQIEESNNPAYAVWVEKDLRKGWTALEKMW